MTHFQHYIYTSQCRYKTNFSLDNGYKYFMLSPETFLQFHFSISFSAGCSVEEINLSKNAVLRFLYVVKKSVSQPLLTAVGTYLLILFPDRAGCQLPNDLSVKIVPSNSPTLPLRTDKAGYQSGDEGIPSREIFLRQIGNPGMMCLPFYII